MKMNFKKGLTRNSMTDGFTLIELLVVVAIISILSSVVLASLRAARLKSADAAIKENLANARSQAEIFYNTNTVTPNSYTGVCTNPGPVGGANTIAAFIIAAAKARGLPSPYYVNGGGGGINIATCTESGLGDAWKVEVPLMTAGQMWCVDSTGMSKQNSGSMGFWWACNF